MCVCVQVTVKREDLTGSILTGNKVRTQPYRGGREGRKGGEGVWVEDWINL